MDRYDEEFSGIRIRRRNTCNGHIHIIEEGDTLYGIARLYDVKLTDLMCLNPYVNVYNLKIGDELCIPVVYEEDEINAYQV